MTDLRLLYDAAQGRADFRLLGASLDTDFDLATAYIVSWFSDRLADPSDPLVPNSDYRAGWWGDGYADTPGDLLGSRLWLLARRKSDGKLPLIAKGYLLEAVQWAIDDKVVARNEAECSFFQGDQRRLGAVVNAYRFDGARAVNLQFDWVWQQMAR